MALTLTTALRNDLADQIDDSVNAGTGGAAQLHITTAANATDLATFTLQNPAFDAAGTGGAGVIQLQGTPLSDTNATAGTAAEFVINDRAAAPEDQLSGTVGTTGGFDIQISSTSIGAGDTVQLTSFSITVPA